METSSMDQHCPTKIKTEIVDEEPTTPVVPPSDIVSHIKTEKPSHDEDQKLDSDCPPLKKRKPEYVEHDLRKEPDQTQQSNPNDGISGCNDDYCSSATEKKFNPNDGFILKGNNGTKDENSECIQRCSPLTIKAANQTAAENYTTLPGICDNEDKMVQVKSEPEHPEENTYIKTKKINGKRRAEKIKWFRCNSEGCPYKTRYYVVFVRHQLSHKYRSRLKCRYCSFSCKSRGMLTSHLLEHIEAQNKGSASPEADSLKEMNWLSCLVENCSFKTKNCSSLEKHVTYHKRQQLLKCRYCSMTCRGRVRMKAHFLRHHRKEKDDRKSCADDQPQIQSSDSDSESEVDIRAMILKDEISDVARERNEKTGLSHEENSQPASQDYKGKLNSCNDTNELAHVLRIDDTKEEINEKESEVKRTITITIRHSKKSEESSSLTTALVSGILKSFDMSDEPSQKHVDEEEGGEKSNGDSNRKSQDIPDSGEFKKPTVVTDILRLFDVSNEDKESGSASVGRQRYTEVQETLTSAPNENTHSMKSFGENTELFFNEKPHSDSRDNQPKIDTLNTSSADGKSGELVENDIGDLVSINEKPQHVLRDNQSTNDAVETSTTDGKPGEIAKSNKCDRLFINEKPQPTLRDNQSKNHTVKTSTTDGTAGELSESNNCDIPINEELQPTLGDNQPKNGIVKTSTIDGKPEELAESNKCVLLSINENPQPMRDIQLENDTIQTPTIDGKSEELAKNSKCEQRSVHENPQPSLRDNQARDGTLETSTVHGKPGELAENNKGELSCINEKPQLTLRDIQSTVETSTTYENCGELAKMNRSELQQSTTTNGVYSFDKSNKEKIANLKQVVIRRVRKIPAKTSGPAEDTRISYSSRILKSPNPGNKEIACADKQCPYKTANAQDMKLHLRFHNDTGTFTCPNCSYGCQNVLDLKEHMNLHIEKCNRMRNNVEISPLTSLTPLQKPNEEDTGQDLGPLIICNPVFTCKFCPTKVNHEKLFKLHLIRHCSTAGIKCPLCTFRSTKTDLLKHLSCHVETVDGMFLCPLCTEMKRNKESLDDHVKVIHSRAIFQQHNDTCNRSFCNGHC